MTSIESSDGGGKAITADVDGTQPVRHRFDWDEIPPSEAVCRAIGVAMNSDPTEIGPLYETVDLEAIDGLLRSAEDDIELSFTHAGLLVVVRGCGEIVVDPVEN
ncbi:hypothetical protein EGH21_16800 [Halomicroarcula sp. F13]|uniref:Halobacterial output domain-containing protein n=1 Tax=Haloarcula rubra TaxID=2487747 RepID=A0AAW4PWN2_9EURY|nr:HalOD1 output domain-containing protein [Halomicroarcula rubra]MBX0324687.1 hypothetical protein [Halomicroarcula rubra]